MQKSDRQKAILKIISQVRVARQDEIADLLREGGFEVTQASVSRDLDEMGIVKINGVYTRPRQAEGADPFGHVSFETAGDALVIAKCASGLASAAAVRIDAAAIPDVAGTIAGDDTIFIAARDGHGQKAVVKALHQLFGSKSGEEFE